MLAVPILPVTIDTTTGTGAREVRAQKASKGGGLHGENAPPEMGVGRSRNNYAAWIMKQGKQP